MQVSKKFFPKVMQDNDTLYLAHLEGIINSVDELSSLEITKNTNSYRFRLAPSLPKYIPMLLEEILKFHNMFRIKLDLSKSIKSSGTIVFEITLNEE
jgi:DNA-binding phage protein